MLVSCPQIPGVPSNRLGSSRSPTQKDLQKIRGMYSCSTPRRDIDSEYDEEEDELTLEAEFNREEAEAEDVFGEDEDDGDDGGGDDYGLVGGDEYGQYGPGDLETYDGDYSSSYGTY